MNTGGTDQKEAHGKSGKKEKADLMSIKV